MKKTMNDINKEKEVETQSYSFYSRVLNKVFDTVEELKTAEAAYQAEIKAKEDKAAIKKADAAKVEEAFKALNAARKSYKEKFNELTVTYSDALIQLKKTLEEGKESLKKELATAEETYAKALKEFTEKYKEGYHITLKDGDFETTISGQNATTTAKKVEPNLLNLFDLFFKF